VPLGEITISFFFLAEKVPKEAKRSYQKHVGCKNHCPVSITRGGREKESTHLGLCHEDQKSAPGGKTVVRGGAAPEGRRLEPEGIGREEGRTRRDVHYGGVEKGIKWGRLPKASKGLEREVGHSGGWLPRAGGDDQKASWRMFQHESRRMK